MKKIILDTNFLVAPFQVSVDIFEEIKNLYPVADVYTLDEVIKEAKSIESGKYGKVVEKLVDTQEVEVLETEGKGEVDDLLLELSDSYSVATNDKELKEKILDRGNEVIIIRQESYLENLNPGEL